jgi:hypothetical protein
LSTFLQLCADLARESGAIGSAPASVVAQTGRQEKAAAWIRDAWTQIQLDRPDYTFLRKSMAGHLQIGVQGYTPVALGITDFGRWIAETPEYAPITFHNGASEVELKYKNYPAWRRSYGVGFAAPNSAPVNWTVDPGSFVSANALLVGPPPDQNYQIFMDYMRAPQILAANDDVPIIPDAYQQIIVWRAIMNLCGSDEAAEAYQFAKLRHDALLVNLERDFLPSFELGGNSLA